MTPQRPYDSVAVAKRMLDIARELGYTLNATQTQKLLYMVYGHFLAQNQLIIKEQPRMWPYGPVFPRVQKRYPEFSIDDPETELAILQDAELNTVLLDIVKRYHIYTAKQLSEWSHMVDSPWEHMFQLTKGAWGVPLDNDVIGRYFKKHPVVLGQPA